MLDAGTNFFFFLNQDAQGKETIVQITIAREEFTATGLMIIARNYLDVYPYDKWNAKVIPNFDQGETFEPTSIQVKNKQINKQTIQNSPFQYTG